MDDYRDLVGTSLALLCAGVMLVAGRLFLEREAANAELGREAETAHLAPPPLNAGAAITSGRCGIQITRRPSLRISRISMSISLCSSVSFSKSVFAARSRIGRRAFRMPWVR